MILSDREIRAALVRESIRITPDPRDDPRVWSSTALDLRLHEQIAVWESPPRVEAALRPADPGFDLGATMEEHGRIMLIPADGHLMRPGEFLLGWTMERIQLPFRSRIAARVEGRSSLARLGLGVHVTAPTIHAGFGSILEQPEYLGSPIQLEIWNVGPMPLVLATGMRICQLIFELVDGTPELSYEGRFSIQGPAPSPAPPRQKRRRQRGAP